MVSNYNRVTLNQKIVGVYPPISYKFRPGYPPTVLLAFLFGTDALGTRGWDEKMYPSLIQESDLPHPAFRTVSFQNSQINAVYER